MAELLLVALAALLGLAAGVPIHRAIARESPGSGPTARTGAAARIAVMSAASGVFALVTLLSARSAGFGMTPPRELPVAFALSTAALLLVAAASIALTVIDIRTHRLPNAIVLPTLGATVGVLAASCLFGAPWQGFARSVTVAAALFMIFAALRVIGRGAMGGGDVKLAALVGVVLGWAGWSAVLAGVLAAFVLGGLVGSALILARRATRSTRMPFGPFLAAGTWVGAAAGAAPL